MRRIMYVSNIVVAVSLLIRQSELELVNLVVQMVYMLNLSLEDA
jgi:hypothetical protein